MIIRRTTKKDFDKMISLMKTFWPKKSVASLKHGLLKEMKDKNQARFVLYDKENLVGCIWLVRYWTARSDTYQVILEEIIVDKKYRGKGYGLKLLEYAIKYAKKNKACELWLETNIGNKNAQRLYKKSMKLSKHSLIYKIKWN